jgi:hypothetical protein
MPRQKNIGTSRNANARFEKHTITSGPLAVDLHNVRVSRKFPDGLRDLWIEPAYIRRSTLHARKSRIQRWSYALSPERLRVLSIRCLSPNS